MTEVDFPVCRRCGHPVRRNRANYETFEQMHWLCFHLEFEHAAIGPGSDGDPDVSCRDPHCPARAFDPFPVPSWASELE